MDEMRTNYKTAGSAFFFLYDALVAIHPHIIKGEPFRAVMEYNPKSAPEGFKLYFQEYDPQDIDPGSDKPSDHPIHQP